MGGTALGTRWGLVYVELAGGMKTFGTRSFWGSGMRGETLVLWDW